MPRFMIQGVPFESESPSFFRLAPELCNGDTIDVSFLGEGGRQEWCLFHARADGNVFTHCFPSRDAAIEMIATAFKNVGAL